MISTLYSQTCNIVAIILKLDSTGQPGLGSPQHLQYENKVIRQKNTHPPQHYQLQQITVEVLIFQLNCLSTNEHVSGKHARVTISNAQQLVFVALSFVASATLYHNCYGMQRNSNRPLSISFINYNLCHFVHYCFPHGRVQGNGQYVVIYLLVLLQGLGTLRPYGIFCAFNEEQHWIGSVPSLHEAPKRLY